MLLVGFSVPLRKPQVQDSKLRLYGTKVVGLVATMEISTQNHRFAVEPTLGHESTLGTATSPLVAEYK